MDKIHKPYEIIVVVDGFLDKTYENAKKIHSSKVIVTGYQHNHGKGYAVRFGMARAKGDIIIFLDAGMDIDPRGLIIFLKNFENNDADVIIGSKLHPNSKVNYPWQRVILSFGYRTIVKLFFGLHIRDTQVGCKLFKRKVVEDVLPRLLVKQYAFDIEMLAVAHYLGYKKIYEAPVNIIFNGKSSITSKGFWKIIYLMLWDTFAVFYRLKILRYYDNNNKRKWKYDPELRFRVNVI
jgi:glycosyltransferase involved in cell wall biosynthesis